MKPTLTILSLLISLQCVAQYDTLGRFLVPQLLRQYTAIKWSPLSLAEFDNHNICFAIERRYNKKNAVQLTAGYTLPFRNRFSESDFTAKGFKLRFEYRRYLRQMPFNVDWFGGGEVFYTKYSAPEYDAFRDSTVSGQIIRDEFIIHKEMFGAAVRFGMQRRFWKHFLFEGSFGLGFKQRNASATGRYDERQAYHEPMRTHALVGVSNLTGNELTGVLPCNFFVGYFFH